MKKIINIEKLLKRLDSLKWEQSLDANNYSAGYRDGHNDTLDQVKKLLLDKPIKTIRRMGVEEVVLDPEGFVEKYI